MINFSGLATGLDTESIVKQLVAAEMIPANKLEDRKSGATRRLSIISDLVTKLKGLNTAAALINTPSEVRSVSASSSDATKFVVSASGTASVGTFDIRVTSLAAAQTSVSRTFATSGAGAPGTGSVTISVGDSDGVEVAYDAADSLQTIADRINDDVEGANAAVIFNGTTYQLMVSAEEKGVANGLSFVESGDGLDLDEPTNVKVPPRDAAFTLNGVSMTRSTNTVSDVLPGVTLSLLTTHGASDPDTVATIDADPTALQDKVKSLVDAFNAVAEGVNGQLRYTGTAKGSDTLFSDSTMRGLQRRLSELGTGSFGADAQALSAIGISLGRDGKLAMDASKLTAALADDPARIEDMIGGPTGLATSLQGLVTDYTRAGDGFLSAKTSSISTEMRLYDTQIEGIESRASRMGDQLRAQFNTLETLMSNFQAQQASLAQLFG